jgi:alanine dehydrogenase
VLSQRTLHAELDQVVAGLRPGRESPAERILLWHRGLAILDIALGQLILERAQGADAGTMLRYR